MTASATHAGAGGMPEEFKLAILDYVVPDWRNGKRDSSGNRRVRCPLHQPDKRPSFDVHEEKLTWICRSHPDCGSGGAWDLLVRVHGEEGARRFASEYGKRERGEEASRASVQVLGPPTEAIVTSLCQAGRLKHAATLDAVGAKLVHWDGDKSVGTRWLGIQTLAGSYKLWALDSEDRIVVRADGTLTRRNAGPVSVLLSPALRDRNGAQIERLYDVEGESDFLAMIEAGFSHVLCGTGGAGTLKGHETHAEALRAIFASAEVVVIGDLDDAGKAGAEKRAACWLGLGIPVRVPTLPAELGEKGDVRDFLRGLGAADLDALADTAELRQPKATGKEEHAEKDHDENDKPKRPPLDIAAVGFTGDRLRAIRTRVTAPSPLPGILDAEPHLHLLQGRQKGGKTTFALSLARAWALGVRPWPGAPSLPGTRVLVLSHEQPVKRLDDVLRRLQEHAKDGAEGWEDRVVLLGRDQDLPKVGRSLLTLNAESVAEIRAALLAAREAGDPFGLLVLDSLSRLLPPGIPENDNPEMSAWLDALEDLAIEAGIWVVLVHHVGHSDAPGRSEARSAGRGASSIGAVAQVTFLFERVPEEPNRRRLKIDGNAVLPR